MHGGLPGAKVMGLEGRVALVTGASQGIGRACAVGLAELGADVALGSRNLEKLRSVAGEIEALGRKALPMPLDVASGDSVRDGIGQVQEAWQKVDILVNNAGITRDNLLMRMKPEDWEVVIRTNLQGAYHCIRAVLPGMADYQYRFRRRPTGESRPGQLYCLQGGPDRSHQSRGRGGREPQHHRQRGGSRLH